MPTYSPVPGHRVPYDIIGTGYNYSSGASWVQFTPSQLSEMNDEDATIVYEKYDHWVSTGIAIAFGTAVDLKGLFMSNVGNAPWTLFTSTDTVDGADGTWTSRGTIENNASSAAWRGSIIPMDYAGCTGVRIQSSVSGTNSYINTKMLHAYGEFAYPGLNVWDASLDQKVTGQFLDFGDVIRGYTYSRTFRVKNTSTQTANGVVVGTSVLTESSPTIASQITYSTGGAYSATQNIGDLAPGQISGQITCRYAIPVNGQVGTWSGRISLIATSWT